MEIFSDRTEDFVWHITHKVREMHKKYLKIEGFCGNFHRYNSKHTNTIRM